MVGREGDALLGNYVRQSALTHYWTGTFYFQMLVGQFITIEIIYLTCDQGNYCILMVDNSLIPICIILIHGEFFVMNQNLAPSLVVTL